MLGVLGRRACCNHALCLCASCGWNTRLQGNVTRESLKCIKAEFVGILEMAGFGILPGRLATEMPRLLFDGAEPTADLEGFSQWMADFNVVKVPKGCVCCANRRHLECFAQSFCCACGKSQLSDKVRFVPHKPQNTDTFVLGASHNRCLPFSRQCLAPCPFRIRANH
jgi:hypothetical protein